MTDIHRNRPRDIGYSKTVMKYYQKESDDSWTKNEANTIFAGKMQKDLFIFAMSIGKYFNKKSSEIKSKQNNVSVDAMNENQRWAVLSIGLAEDKNLLNLKDETPFYLKAERYAEGGIEIIKSHMDYHHESYSDFLEKLLNDILEGKKSK
jgi:hypothetical protein